MKCGHLGMGLNGRSGKMKRVTKISLMASGLILLAGLAGILPSSWLLTELNAVVQANNDNDDRHRAFDFDVLLFGLIHSAFLLCAFFRKIKERGSVHPNLAL